MQLENGTANPNMWFGPISLIKNCVLACRPLRHAHTAAGAEAGGSTVSGGSTSVAPVMAASGGGASISVQVRGVAKD